MWGFSSLSSVSSSPPPPPPMLVLVLVLVLVLELELELELELVLVVWRRRDILAARTHGVAAGWWMVWIIAIEYARRVRGVGGIGLSLVLLTLF